MRIFFMGTPQLAVPVLKSMTESKHHVVLVITQPDKPAGRQQQLTPSPVKVFAQSLGIPVLQPTKLNNEEFNEQMNDINADIGVVFAYGKILPKWLLDLPQYGVVNVHASLLPRWRGAAPIQRAIMAGDTTTGVTIMQMAEGLDTGAILLKHEIPIEPADTTGTLTEKISTISADTIIYALDRIEAGITQPVVQDELRVTYADKISDADTEIDWTDSAETIRNKVGLNPKPGVRTTIGQVPVKVLMVEVKDISGAALPGDIIAIDKNKGPIIATGTKPLAVIEVQPANKKRMSGAEFARGYLNG